MKTYAKFSACRKYRFALWRIWDESKPYAMFIGLNPSTADEVENDNTITRCINFAKEWGYGGLCMANLFAYRATDPAVMKTELKPVGEGNNEWLVELALDAGIVIAAWGNDGSHFNRSAEVLKLIPSLHYLKLNNTGEPAHPLYLSSSLKPQPMII
ncbi:DUF1643 domain-containing protein [Plesiomonas shigelloides]|uniref:DUF1643 domain-containing protein n=1 Tax=Plesiomonas shigelloides TaxID=703 RepID=UPI0022453659|nr:DUF1643 domain-containing protein [Plesiomonas shigelloides]MCX2534484.1 DUF1643 domain-containing protein [Plesiomonas shigelloides]